MKKRGEKMQESDIVERLTKTEERSKSNTHRLDKLEPIINEIHTMSKTMVQLTEELKHTNEAVNSLDEKIDHMDSRVDSMEHSPVEDIKAYKKTAITTIISTLVGAFAAGLLVLITSYI